MIEKITNQNQIARHKLAEKINELVDAVNGILAAQEQYATIYNEDIVPMLTPQNEEPPKNIPEPIKLYVCADGSMYDNEDVAKSHAASIFNPLPAGATTTDQVYLEQDPYAEQRKCICKLCWFWNDNKADKIIGILTGVFDEADRPFERNINQTLYKHCEPVKPDDSIIFKGE